MVWLVLCGLSCAGCNQRAGSTRVNHALEYGLKEGTIHRQLIERAVALANVSLASDVPQRLQITWDESGLFPRFRFASERAPHPDAVLNESPDICLYRGFVRIPVYLVDDDQLGARENTFVPDGCRCVFVNARTIDGILDGFGIGAGTRLSQYSEYEQASVYATVLLHEIGHLHNGDNGSYTEAVALTAGEVAQGLNSAANKEVRADRFAVEQLQKALVENNWRPFLGLGSGRSSVANHLLYVINVAVNTYDYRNDPWGYLNGQADPGRYTARSYSHLNLQLRLLVMLYQMEPDASRREHLRQLLGQALDRDFGPVPGR